MTTRIVTIYTCEKCGKEEETLGESPRDWRALNGGFDRVQAVTERGWMWDLCSRCYGEIACSIGKHEGYITSNPDERNVCHRCKERFR